MNRLFGQKATQAIKTGERWVGRMVGAMRVAACITMLVFLTMVFVQVVMRYCFNSPIYGLDECVTALMVWSMAVGVPVVYWERGHAMIEFLYKKLSGRPRRVAGVLSYLVVLSVSYIFIPSGIGLFRLQTMQLPVGGLPFCRAYYHALPMIVMGVLSCILPLFRFAEYVVLRDDSLVVRGEEEGGALYE